MLPGKKYAAEDILGIARRRGWLVLIPFVVGAVGTAVWSKQLPNRYRSETLIMLTPQRIPDSYVKTTVTTRIEDRLNTLSDQILSRSRLERIIVDLDLYAKERTQLAMEDVVQRMRNDIGPIRVEGKESFRVQYVSGDAAVAQKVTERLASLFIEENLRDRENVAADTNRFLDSQLDDAKRRLIEQEKRLEEYRRRYSGQLPSQLQANLQAIQGADAQRQALAQSMDRERERRIQLERQLAELQTPEPTIVQAPAAASGVSPENLSGGSITQQLEAARTALRLLQLRNTPDHPDVRIMERRIADLEQKQKAEAEAGATANADRPVTAADLLRQRRIRDLEGQIAAVDRQLKEYDDQNKRLTSVVTDYQAKIDALPTRESELVELTRDYATLQNSYQSLLAKREESKIAVNLERRNIGEQFRILDPARVPERPFTPNRRSLTLTGAGIGLAVGLLLVGLLEYRDTSFRNDDDVIRALSLPVIAVIPLVRTARERQLRRRLVSVATALGVVASAAVLAWWRLRP
jgi:polysaccharide chain length determinant protein (PEP-CTERM system associated)